MTDEIVAAARAAFSRDYFDARARFRTAAPQARAYSSAATGPEGEPLFTDVAWFGDPDARRVFVTISSTHGVEGYCGSGCQIDWVRSGGAEALRPGEAALVIHAVNPYGFSWDRRVTEENCDLNRNFLDFTQPVPPNPGHDELSAHLVPADLDGPAFAEAERVIAAFRKANGEVAFQVARKAGQYKHPKSMFFGGLAPSGPRRTLEQIVADHRIAARDFVAIVDFHTGLGPFGYGELQTETVTMPHGYEMARKIWGQSVTSPALGTSSSIALNGTMDEYWLRLLGRKQVYVCLEYGTYDQENGRRVLRQDHWLHAHGGNRPDPTLLARFRKDMRDHFFPDVDDWKEMVLWRSRQVQRQAIEGLRLFG